MLLLPVADNRLMYMLFSYLHKGVKFRLSEALSKGVNKNKNFGSTPPGKEWSYVVIVLSPLIKLLRTTFMNLPSDTDILKNFFSLRFFIPIRHLKETDTFPCRYYQF